VHYMLYCTNIERDIAYNMVRFQAECLYVSGPVHNLPNFQLWIAQSGSHPASPVFHLISERYTKSQFELSEIYCDPEVRDFGVLLLFACLVKTYRTVGIL
jgi:hypothetical protein